MSVIEQVSAFSLDVFLMKEHMRGFQPRTVYYKYKQGNLTGDKEEVLNRWTEYFKELI